ncbi:putative methyltransferase YcgJ [Rubripirellula amarantea]|uniref:Putative methyltransferase YcgJ n=1 Tax=Rubripirellula amarantea TaxID=2527999 RepID=A0A5C5WGR4_9BACT|nr:methyltransferase domain-containing protein [Rubripirellula amarantea]TWT49301.1 putative methyltransferase YcgJ [Rubripirellula amarantea]
MKICVATKSITAIILVASIAISSIAWCQEVNPSATVVPEGINDKFKDENLKVDEWIDRFEVESREVYAAREEVLSACDIMPGDRIADVGAGTGFYSRSFAKRTGESGWVYSIDVSSKFLQHIATQSTADGIENLTTALGTDVSIRLPPESVDLVFICDTYHHFESPQQSLSSIYRALKPNGRLVLIDFNRIPGVSREFLIGHVRAGKEVFRNEIVSAGFQFTDEVTIHGFKENYLLRFRKPVASPSPPSTSIADPRSSEDVAAAYPSGPLGEMVRLGETLVNETSSHPLTRSFVGNQLNCTSCHLEAGRHREAASFRGVAAAYPAYSPRESSVITLEDRIGNCFLRSQNGSRPALGSQVSVAIAAYITWLSRQTPIDMNPDAPLGPNRLTMIDVDSIESDYSRGKSLYESRCADCHLEDGSGSDEGPPVWGEQSFNDGAGLSKVPKMASWLKVAMPPGDADLTDQEAVDIAAFINSNARPKFQPQRTGEWKQDKSNGR